MRISDWSSDVCSSDLSTVTRSPTNTRIRCLRIRPEVWARTLWPLSSVTRNIAFGRISATVPSISISSSLAIHVLVLVALGQEDEEGRRATQDFVAPAASQIRLGLRREKRPDPMNAQIGRGAGREKV